MPEIIENSKIGNYYLIALPYIEEMSVSFNKDTKTFSLECDELYNKADIIGNFTGYLGNFDLEGKLILGLTNATGLIYINKTEFYEISDGIIKKGNYDEYNYDSEEEYNYIDKPKLYISECTSIECGVNKNSELLIHSYLNPNNDKKSYGIFFGQPGEYYYDEQLKNRNRRYGNEYSSGTINLTGPYNFKYIYDKGHIIQCKFNNKNIYKSKSFLKYRNFLNLSSY
jgi:hypothetical protein